MSGQREHIVIVGAGPAGLMAARDLARAGRRVSLLEARARCGGRIDQLPVAQFGYAAERGAEFVHGEAPVTRALLREAGLSLRIIDGTQWSFDGETLAHEGREDPRDAELHAALADLKEDLTVADFLRRHFAGERYSRMRRSIERMVEGYDAADPERASILALREEWMGSGEHPQARIVGGYAGLVAFLQSECRKHGVTFRFAHVVTAIEEGTDALSVRSAAGDVDACDRVILTVPLPLLKDIALPASARKAAAAAADIGFGNVIKLLLRFKTSWWSDRRPDLADATFLLSEQIIPVWWTQYPERHPVLTGWFGGPRTATLAHLNSSQLIEAGLASLASMFGLPRNELAGDVVAAEAANWAHDRFARGAYSWATPQTRAAQAILAGGDGRVLFSGEALYRGRDMGTVEAALASGAETAAKILQA
jgi:monoamine oxidase